MFLLSKVFYGYELYWNKVKNIFFFQLSWGGYVKELKELGRNDTTHNDEIAKESLVKIHKMLAVVLEMMKCGDEKNTERYKKLIPKLPEDYRFEYHRLIQFGLYFIIGMNFAKRGREGKIHIYLKLFG